MKNHQANNDNNDCGSSRKGWGIRNHILVLFHELMEDICLFWCMIEIFFIDRPPYDIFTIGTVTSKYNFWGVHKKK